MPWGRSQILVMNNRMAGVAQREQRQKRRTCVTPKKRLIIPRHSPQNALKPPEQHLSPKNRVVFRGQGLF